MKILQWFGGAVVGASVAAAVSLSAAPGDVIVKERQECKKIAAPVAACVASCLRDADALPAAIPASRIQSAGVLRDGRGGFCARAEYYNHKAWADFDGDGEVVGKVK